MADKLDSDKAGFSRQPKIGVSLFIKSQKDEILLEKRKYQPNKGLMGFHSEKVRANETLRDAAKRCLKEETGLGGNFKYAGILRIIRDQINRYPLDVVLIFFEVNQLKGDLIVETSRNENIWVKLTDLDNLKKTFPDFDKDVELFRGEKPFFSERVNMDKIS